MFRSLLTGSVLVAALAAACAGPGATPVPTARPATPAPASAPASAAAGPTVGLASAGYFVGPNGMTLYTFDKDVMGQSNCSGQCATSWPALTLPSGGAISVGTGLTASDFATITRADNGAAQVTFHSIPLYFFGGDTKPGDTNGEGVGGVWHKATASSTLPVASAPAVSPSAVPTMAAGASGSPEACFDLNGYPIKCPPASPAGATVSLSTAGYLVAANGMSLYEFDKDTTPNTSSCLAGCATNWPALTLTTGQTISVGAGIDLGDFASFTRTDDSALQVTYYGKPLYFFAGDTAPGQTNGDGVGGIWHVARPQ